MNINYIKNVLEKNKKKDFSQILKIREHKIKMFSLPISILAIIMIFLFADIVLNIRTYIEDSGIVNIYIISFLLLSVFISYQIYLISQGIIAYLFDKKLEENNKDLKEIYKKVFFIKYRDEIENDNPFPYFLSELNDISEEEIKEYLDLMQKVNKI